MTASQTPPRVCIVTFITVLLIVGCGSPPPEMPTLTGAIVLSNWIEISPDSNIFPDSVEVYLNGLSHGWHPNPDTLWDIEQGSYTLKSYCRYNDQIYGSPIRDVFVEFDALVEVSLTLISTGVLKINVTSGDARIDSFGVKLDGDTVGLGWNPFYIDVPEGIHKLVVFSQIDTLRREGWLQDVQVTAAETTEVEIEVVPVSPLEGVHALDIDCVDLDGIRYSLSDHWGEVIYLYFFEHT